MAEEKQYGLIIPGANKPKKSIAIRKLNPLQDSDDELENDGPEPLNWVEASLKKSAGNAGQQSLQKRLLREALEEDSSVFQYDEVYDAIQDKKNVAEQARKNSANKKPKYIENILKTAEKRKIENERRTERTVQKERDAEGDQFADKESFVTESYKNKLVELRKAEAEERIERLREEQVDVMKHKNFGVFYNHIFKQRMGETEIKTEPPDDTNNAAVSTAPKSGENQRNKNYRNQEDLSESPDRETNKKIKSEPESHSDSSSEEEQNNRSEPKSTGQFKKLSEQKSCNYRSRSKDRRRGRSRSRSRHNRRRSRSASNSKSSGNRASSRRHSRSRRSRSRDKHRDYDKGKTSKRSKSRSPHKRSRKQRSRSRSGSPSKDNKVSKHKDKKIESSSSSERSTEKQDKKNKTSEQVEEKNHKPLLTAEEIEIENKKKKLEMITKLFSKRTVGEVYDSAVQKYFERKAERDARG